MLHSLPATWLFSLFAFKLPGLKAFQLPSLPAFKPICYITALFLVIICSGVSSAETVKLEATADIWLSDANSEERNSSSGKCREFKLKSIQEMAAVRFDASILKGKKINAARLFLRPVQKENELRYIRISTVSQDWKEGYTHRPYGKADGATYNYADHQSQKAWAWPGSQFCDVTFSSGNTLTSWTERRLEENGWISVDIDPKLIYALAVGDTDGLALQDGGTPNYFNNYVYSRESGRFAPHLIVDASGAFKISPAKPSVKAEPDPEHADFEHGAIKITLSPAANAFRWIVYLNEYQVDRWRIKHPDPENSVEFYIDGLLPLQACNLKVVAVSKSGHTSPPAMATVQASDRLTNKIQLGKFNEPKIDSSWEEGQDGKIDIWPVPGLIKIDPITGNPLHNDVLLRGGSRNSANAVWDGNRVTLFGIRGEYVDFQICIAKQNDASERMSLRISHLTGPNGSIIDRPEIELFKNWYSQRKDGNWQPAYNIPIKHGEFFQIPDTKRGILNQQNQTFYVDIYIPKNAVPGNYHGEIILTAGDNTSEKVPIELTVYDLLMPDDLAFLPELNAYRIPHNVHDYCRLAHQHRCIANFWVMRPKITKAGDRFSINWIDYDRLVGPLVSGEAFKTNRRAGHPTECLYLPFEDSWPTPLTPETYNYKGYWPGRGESKKHIVDHYLTAPHIGDALSDAYKDTFLRLQESFIEHFRRKGWNNTEMQCFFGGKNTHRIAYGTNMWWTTDEPYHWDDWLALHFFDALWTKGRIDNDASKKLWPARADISRPQWQGRVMEEVTDVVYIGGYNDERTYKRCGILKEDTGVTIRAYGSANPHDHSNTETVALLLSMWLNGAEGFLPWQTLGSDSSLDRQEGISGNALFAPGDRFGIPVVGDMRLKAFRKGEQIIEYLDMLSEKYSLQRKQINKMVNDAIELSVGRMPGAGSDNADAIRAGTLKAWQIDGLRHAILSLILGNTLAL